MARTAALKRYQAKRNFDITPEPAEGGESLPGALQFVVQKLAEYPNRQQGWEDAIWAILNTREFQFVK